MRLSRWPARGAVERAVQLLEECLFRFGGIARIAPAQAHAAIGDGVEQSILPHFQRQPRPDGRTDQPREIGFHRHEAGGERELIHVENQDGPRPAGRGPQRHHPFRIRGIGWPRRGRLPREQRRRAVGDERERSNRRPLERQFRPGRRDGDARHLGRREIRGESQRDGIRFGGHGGAEFIEDKTKCRFRDERMAADPP